MSDRTQGNIPPVMLKYTAAIAGSVLFASMSILLEPDNLFYSITAEVLRKTNIELLQNSWNKGIVLTEYMILIIALLYVELILSNKWSVVVPLIKGVDLCDKGRMRTLNGIQNLEKIATAGQVFAIFFLLLSVSSAVMIMMINLHYTEKAVLSLIPTISALESRLAFARFERLPLYQSFAKASYEAIDRITGTKNSSYSV